MIDEFAEGKAQRVERLAMQIKSCIILGKYVLANTMISEMQDALTVLQQYVQKKVK